MASAAQLALGLGRSYGSTLARLRAGAIPGASKRERRWEIPTSAVQEAYAQRADAYFQARLAIPRDAHYPKPDLTDAWFYQFVVTVELTDEDDETHEETDFSFALRTEPGDPKPSSRLLWRRLREQVEQTYVAQIYGEKYVGRNIVSARLLSAYVVRAMRRGRQ